MKKTIFKVGREFLISSTNGYADDRDFDQKAGWDKQDKNLNIWRKKFNLNGLKQFLIKERQFSELPNTQPPTGNSENCRSLPPPR